MSIESLYESNWTVRAWATSIFEIMVLPYVFYYLFRGDWEGAIIYAFIWAGLAGMVTVSGGRPWLRLLRGKISNMRAEEQL